MAKIIVVGGTGLIGSKVVAKLTAHGHEAVAAAPRTGVDTVTGEGLAEALAGAWLHNRQVRTWSRQAREPDSLHSPQKTWRP